MKQAWIASAVASILFAAGVTFVGAEQTEPESAVPLPGSGATATYLATPLGTGDNYGLERVHLVWRSPELVRDENYDLRHAWPVDIRLEGPSIDHRLWAYYDTETLEPLLDGQKSSILVAGGGITQLSISTSPGYEYEIAFDQYHFLRGLCGLMDGPNLGAGNQELTGHCGRLDGTQKTLMTKVDARSYVNPADERFQVAYKPGVPFPQKLTAAFSDMLLEMPHTNVAWQLELEAWEGATPFVIAPSLVEEAAAPEMLPPTPWGLDDSRIDHPFPLREAYAAAVASTSGSTVSDFLANHPDAFLRSAWSTREKDGNDNYRYNWWLTWTDGVDWIGKQVSHVPSTLPGAAGTLPPSTSVTAYTPGNAAQPMPGPHLIPDSFPSPYDILNLQRLYAGDDEYLNRYGFEIYCRNQCTDSLILVAAGAHTVDSPGDFDDPQALVRTATVGQTIEYNQLMTLGDGSPIYTERALYRQQPIVSAATYSSPQETPGSSAGWTPPSAGKVATAGAFAAVGGLLVYLLPGLKAPGLALFSRIRGEHLLEHPARAAIMAVVNAEPGIHFHELKRRLDQGGSTLQHHLKKLADGKHIRTKVSPGYTCYFPRKVDKASLAAAPFLRAPGPRAILEAVVHGKDGTVRYISKETGLSPSTVSHHLMRMRDAGLVSGGGRDGFAPTPAAIKAV